ncbi:M [Anser fabalis coronavirus NCN2]|nr:M [Anser fabalis coronavirus NCN2] [Anser fabalis coronavirus NCN2]
MSGSNETVNCTLDVNQAEKVFKEYNLFLTCFFLFMTFVLQYGYATRSRFMYIIKMIVLWLFWPLNIAVGVLSCMWPVNTGGFVAAIVLTIMAILAFLGYWIQSIRLFKRCASFWAFNPESNAVGSINLNNGTVCKFSIESVPMVLSPIIKAGVLYCEGQWLTKCTPSEVPNYMYVCTPDRRHTYKRVAAYAGDNKTKKSFATFIFTKEKVDTGDLDKVTTSVGDLYQ